MSRRSRLTIAYHVTPRRNLKRILSEGLIPRVGPRSKRLGEIEPAIYVFTSMAGVEDALMNWLGDEFADSTPVVVLRITLPQGASDESAAAYERLVRHAIAPASINVLPAAHRLTRRTSLSNKHRR